MSCFVFAGPSLRHEVIRERLPAATVLPPAAQGDLARAARSGARIIGLIDGYFEGVPSVWHKEILWALARGVHVYGASSMGALRASELHPFGMRGVGAIFEAFRDGDLEDDDEVAVQHGPPETGFVALSEAMVNIRTTLRRAVAEGVLTTGMSRDLEVIAKAQFYQQRTWDRVLEIGSAEFVESKPLEALRGWLPVGRIDQKRDDAVALIAALDAALADGLAPFEPGFVFEETAMWDDALSAGWSTSLGGEEQLGGEGDGLAYELVLDELRLHGRPFAEAMPRARSRLRALRDAERSGLQPDEKDVRAELQRFRIDLGLTARTSLDRWLVENDLDIPALQSLIEDEARLAGVEADWRPAHGEQLLAELRRSGDYAALAKRARQKQAALADAGYDDVDASDCGESPVQLLAWFLRRSGCESLPADRDGVMQVLGLSNSDNLNRLIAREYLYCRLTMESSGGQSDD